jgi:hypothetical protein
LASLTGLLFGEESKDLLKSLSLGGENTLYGSGGIILVSPLYRFYLLAFYFTSMSTIVSSGNGSGLNSLRLACIIFVLVWGSSSSISTSFSSCCLRRLASLDRSRELAWLKRLTKVVDPPRVRPRDVPPPP